MAKVSLRIYNREIERLIEQGNLDEAIAHCRHILTTFPKHLETYRLLGKAYLEARRYNEAVDIFGRLLMAVPDDFVAHVGLSIIRDEENKMDDAIWHMERAFEVQSANAAIQGELQRLYGRRDGVEPPKVRMTRGALARIYVQGELYPQAIAEIRSVLGEDPQRADMQVLLALSYFRSGQKSDASDLCNQLLKGYPYCYEANRIMVDLLPATTGSAESTQVYRMRVGEMDPYANFTRGSIFQSNEVTDASVNLERLEYTGEEVEMGQNWGSSLGIASSSVPALGATVSDEQPDWLRSGGMEEETPSASSEPQSGEEIPDFLRAAGWGEAQGPERPTSIFDEEPADSGDLVPADLPDWLKGQTPEPSQQPEPQAAAEPESIDTPDWLKGLEGTGDEPASAESSFMESDSASAGDVPDWLSGLGAAGAAGAVASTMSEPAAEEEEPAVAGDVPDWLQGLGGEQISESSEPAQGEEEAMPADIPDWLKGSEPKEEAKPSVENLGASAQEQDDAVAWLESLAAKHGAKPEELVTDPTKRSETPPDWVAQAQNAGQQASEQPSKPDVSSLGSSAQEQDDAVAWLESLAAKHGAKPEELVTDPNKRSETPPDWVQQAQSAGEVASSAPQQEAETKWVENAQNVGEEFFAEFEKGETTESATDETGVWLRSLDEKEEQEKPAGETSDLPDWMKPEPEEEPLERGEIPEWLSESAQPATSTGEPEKEKAEPTADLPNWLDTLESETHVSADDVMGNQDLSDWLSGLDNEPGLELDDEFLRASQRAPFPSGGKKDEPQATETELPAWLDETKDEFAEEPAASTPTEEPAPVTLTADLPDWLQGVDEESGASDSDKDLPPWLYREQWETEASPEQPKPTSPSDWHPVSEKSSVTKPQPKQTPPQVRDQRFVQRVPSPEPAEKPAAEKKKSPAKSSRPSRKAEGQGSVSLLTQAKAELERGDIPEALVHYGKLIKKGKHLEETISQLTESLYRYPVEVSIWQALGDAYMRANRLKEALEAYNKAEELIR